MRDDSASGGPKKPRPVATTAPLRVPRRCVSGPARIVVRGKGIRKVVSYVNGRRVSVVRGRRAAYATRVKGDAKVLRIRARVTFVARGRSRARTLRTTLLACQSKAPAVRPHFTG